MTVLLEYLDNVFPVCIVASALKLTDAYSYSSLGWLSHLHINFQAILCSLRRKLLEKLSHNLYQS